MGYTQLHCSVVEKRQNSEMTQGAEGETFSFIMTEPNRKQSSAWIHQWSVSQCPPCLSSTLLSYQHYLLLSLSLYLFDFSDFFMSLIFPFASLSVSRIELKRFLGSKVTD